MRYTADREGHKWQESTGQDKLLEKLYGSAVGRCILRPLVSPVVSKLGGRILDSRISVLAVEPFIRRNGINREDYEEKEKVEFIIFVCIYYQCDNTGRLWKNSRRGKSV